MKTELKSAPQVGRREAVVALGCLLAATSFGSRAQLPSGKPYKLIVGFPAGGSTDVMARVLADALRGQLAGPVLIENRPGAGGRLAVESMRTADIDGTAILITPFHMITMYPHMYRKVSYDPQRDLLPIGQVASMPMLIAVGPAVPSAVKTISDYLQWVKAAPGRNSFASPGPGTLNHFIGVLLSKQSGVELLHVPYKGDAPAVQDLLGGHIPLSMNVPSALLPHLASGRVRILATTGAERAADLPNIPTLAESGFPKIKEGGWFGAFVPARTPPAVVAKLESELRQALGNQALKEAFAKQGIYPEFVSSSDFGKQIARESSTWAAVVKETGFTLDE